MGTTSEKLTYLNDTKQLLKENINNLGGNLTNEPFRQYVSVLEGIYERLPKVSGIGASLSLNPSLIGKIKLNEIQGNTYQQTYSGKNLFNKNSSITNGQTFGPNGNYINANDFFFQYEYIPVEPNTTYSISGSKVGGSDSIRVCEYTSDKTFIKRDYEVYTITTSENTYFIRVSNYQSKLDTLQIEKGTTSTDYEPYVGRVPSPNPDYPQEIQSVTGLQNVEVCGKNMLDYSTMVDGYVQSNGTFYTGTPVNEEMRSDFIKVKPNTTYTFKIFESSWNKFNIDNWFGVGEYSSNNTNSWLIRNTMTTGTQNYITFTTNSATQYIVVSARGLKTATKVQLEIGNATTYEPYKGNTYEVNLGKNLLKNTLLLTERTVSGITATPNSDGSIKLNGTANADVYINLAQIDFGNTTFNSNTGGSNKYVASLGIVSSSTRLAYSGNNKYSYIVIWQGTVLNNVIVYPMIEKGPQATSYSPYFTPYELNKIGDYEDSIKKSTGKNLFDKNAVTRNKIINRDSGTTSTISNYAATDYIPIGENVTFTCTGFNVWYTACYDSNKTYLGYMENSNTMTTLPNTAYIRASILLTNLDLGIGQIELGNQQTSPEPYGKVWYVENNIGKVVLNGSENYNNSGTTTSGNYRISYTGLENIILRPSSAGTVGNILCSHFVARTGNETYRCNQGISVEINGNISIYDNSNTSGNTTTFKTWLASNNMTIKYALATPTYTTITNTELIEQLETLYNAKSKNGTTNIVITSNGNGLAMDVSVSVLKGE